MTRTVLPIPVPDDSLLHAFAQAAGHYVDCFAVQVPKQVALADLIRAFYTTPLFRAERLVLRYAAGAASTDAEVDDLATGVSDRFAVWTVTDRRADQVLLSERSGRTKSWLQTVPGGESTQLRFGSVVVPVPRRRDGKLVLGPVFDALLGAHQLYSRALLGSAAARVTRAPTVRLDR